MTSIIAEQHSTVTPRDARQQALLAGCLALMLFVAASWHQTIVGFDSRFVLFAQEMLRHGPGFFPTTYGQPYPDYSAFSTFLIYLCSLPSGEVSSLTAWLPTALASALMVALIHRLLSPYSQRWAWLSIALLMLSNTFITETRAVSQDQMLATVSFAVFYLGYAHDHFSTPRRMLGIFTLLVLGFAIRGPIGLVIPTGVLCSYYLMTSQWRRFWVFGFSALTLLVACVAALLGMAWLDGGRDFVGEVLRMQVFSRLDGSEGKSTVFWYFTGSLGNYALAYPLALVALVALAFDGRRPGNPALRLVYLCLAAGLTVMIGLSIPQAKKARYILPMLPMAAIIAAYPFHVSQGRGFAWARGLVLALCGCLPGALVIGLWLVRPRFPQLLESVAPILVVLGLLQLITLALLVRPRLRIFGLPLCAVLAVWTTYIGVFEKAERTLYDTQHFTEAVREVTKHDAAPLVLYSMGKDAKAIKFMVNVDEDLQPVFADTAAQLETIKGPANLMMSNGDFQKLQATRLAALPVVLSGRFDNEDYVLLRLPQG